MINNTHNSTKKRFLWIFVVVLVGAIVVVVFFVNRNPLLALNNGLGTRENPIDAEWAHFTTADIRFSQYSKMGEFLFPEFEIACKDKECVGADLQGSLIDDAGKEWVFDPLNSSLGAIALRYKTVPKGATVSGKVAVQYRRAASNILGSPDVRISRLKISWREEVLYLTGFIIRGTAGN